MKCENRIPDVGEYFVQGRRTLRRCDGEALWSVRVNPPSAKSDGTVNLCDHCNRFEYLYFPRVALAGEKP